MERTDVSVICAKGMVCSIEALSPTQMSIGLFPLLKEIPVSELHDEYLARCIRAITDEVTRVMIEYATQG